MDIIEHPVIVYSLNQFDSICDELHETVVKHSLSRCLHDVTKANIGRVSASSVTCIISYDMGKTCDNNFRQQDHKYLPVRYNRLFSCNKWI